MKNHSKLPVNNFFKICKKIKPELLQRHFSQSFSRFSDHLLCRNIFWMSVSGPLGKGPEKTERNIGAIGFFKRITLVQPEIYFSWTLPKKNSLELAKIKTFEYFQYQQWYINQKHPLQEVLEKRCSWNSITLLTII